MNPLVLLLADGRFPAGGYAHSGGMEAAVLDGRVSDGTTLDSFLRGRLATAGRVAAGLAAAAALGTHDLDDLEREATARIASPALRLASQVQGRQLLRAATATLGRPLPVIAAHHAIAMGMVARVAGASPMEAARWAAYESAAGPASAAIRLLGLDPFTTWASVSALDAVMEEIAAEAAASAPGPLSRLPACSAPLLDLGAERHATEEVRLFAS